MFQVKQMLAVALLLQIFGLLVFCDAQKDGSPLLARRLLGEISLEEVENVDDMVFDLVVDTSANQVNATFEVAFDEGPEQLGLYTETVTDSDETSGPEGGRRNLVACGPKPYGPAMKFHDVRVNGQCLSPYEPLTVPRYVRIGISVEDEDVHCPGCIEQIHFGVLDGQHECLNAGGGNFGRKNLNAVFSLSPGYHWVYVYGGWKYTCRDHFWFGDINRQVEAHWGTTIAGLLYVE